MGRRAARRSRRNVAQRLKREASHTAEVKQHKRPARVATLKPYTLKLEHIRQLELWKKRADAM